MNFIIDAHLPKVIGSYFEAEGHAVIHTSSLEFGNETPDHNINALANDMRAVVITKDQDFYHSHLLKNTPPKLVLVKVGNLTLKAVKHLFENQTKNILQLLIDYDLVEVYRDRIIGVS